MKLPTSDKTSSFVKPHIKKGYYPAKLQKVEAYTDSDGKPKEGKFGRQLIFEFAVYESDPKTDAPIKPMTVVDGNITSDVVIPKFVYHQYKNKDGDGYNTAITPNSAITKLLQALGWEFSTKDVDIDPLIGNWVEVNIDDYEAKKGDETVTASTIAKVNPYKGPKVDKKVDSTKPKEPKKVEKTVKHSAVKEEDMTEVDNAVKKQISKEDGVELNEARQKKAAEFKEMLDQKLVSQEGYDKMIESLEADQQADNKG